MSLPRFFVHQPCAPGAEVHLDPSDARHVTKVLRMKAGDALTIVSQRKAWQAKLTAAERDRAIASIVEPSTQQSTELAVEVSVLQALPKAAKMDEVIEKVVELGAQRIVPIRCERSYGGDSERKIERWRRVARAAAQQSQRLIVPAVEAPADFTTAILRFASGAHVILAHEQAPRGSLAEALRRADTGPIALAIGPEGSFTAAELETANAAGCDIVSLGPTTLRTETAAAAMLAAIAVLRGWW